MEMLLPQAEFDRLPPNVKPLFSKWATFLHEKVDFNMPDSLFHAAPHCERVLLYALIIGEKILGNNPEALETLAHAAIFHDTRRLDDYLDTGHGARGAVHYEQQCREDSSLKFHPESVYLMRYHDLDDEIGIKAISSHFSQGKELPLTLYSIFKDADALDRWRLGPRGLDPRYLRTKEARQMTEFSRNIVKITTPPAVQSEIDEIINKFLDEIENNPDFKG
ncbi:MAG: HD domain-containing protein [Muribaculaceae bacterium]|nr:HD domain-containing protein [Muribaculaceae bacterium]